jgi:ATP-dependent protease HslVU (ClpYQ) peptidase subunit
MTVIAVKDGIMAADSMATRGGMRHNMPTAYPKIIRAPDGSLVGYSGGVPKCYALAEWVKKGMDFGDHPPFAHEDSDMGMDALWLKADGTLWRLCFDYTVYPLDGDEPYTIGEIDAASFTEGAMWAGLSAEDAIQLAAMRCLYANGEVQVEKLHP